MTGAQSDTTVALMLTASADLPILLAAFGGAVLAVGSALVLVRWLQRRGFSTRAVMLIGIPSLLAISAALLIAAEHGSGTSTITLFVLTLLALTGLLATTITDLRGREVYVEPLYLLAIVGALLGLFAWQSQPGVLNELLFGSWQGFGGMLWCGGIFLLFHLLGRLFGHVSGITARAVEEDGSLASEAILGSGDMAVAALIGAWLGPVLGTSALLLGALLQFPLIVVLLVWKWSSASRRHQLTYVPYVPGLAAGALLVWLWPQLPGLFLGLA